MQLFLRKQYGADQFSFGRLLVSILLIVAICFLFSPFPNVGSQSYGAVTTMTISQPPSGGCAMVSRAFLAQADVIITGTFGADASISFYIVSQDDFNGLQNCRLQASARPLFIQENVAGLDNPYRARFQSDGTYYYVFTLVLGSNAQLTSGYATVRLSVPASVILIMPEISTGTSVQIPSLSTFIATYTSTSTSTSLKPSLLSSTQPLTSSSKITTTSSLTSSASSQVTTTSQSLVDFIFSGRLSAIGAIATAGSLVLGWLFKTRKRRFLSGYLTKIDSTFNSYAVNREECRGRLNQMKDDVSEMLKAGKIDETHFGILEGKISQYLRDLTSGELPPPPPPPEQDR